MWFFEFPCKVDSRQYFSQAFKKYLNHKCRIVLGNIATYVKSFWKFVKENRVSFYEKHLSSYEESSFKHSIALPNDNFLEQEFENFNQN